MGGLPVAVTGLLGSIVVAPIVFVVTAWKGLFIGASGAAAVLGGRSALPLGASALLGVAAGLTFGWVSRASEVRKELRAERSLISALFSREVWVEQFLATAHRLFVCAAAAYFAAAAVEALVGASSGTGGGVPAMGAAIGGSGGSGGGDGFGGVHSLADLIIAIVAALGVALTIGLVTGFCGGAPAGAAAELASQLFQWSGIVQGAAEEATVSVVARDRGGDPADRGVAGRVVVATLKGGLEGALAGAVATIALSAFHAWARS